MDIRLNDLNKTIVNCKKCPRLVKFVNKVSTNKRKQNKNEIYWGKPLGWRLGLKISNYRFSSCSSWKHKNRKSIYWR